MIKEIIAEKTAVEISPRSGREKCRESGVKTTSVRLARIQAEFAEKIKAPPGGRKGAGYETEQWMHFRRWNRSGNCERSEKGTGRHSGEIRT